MSSARELVSDAQWEEGRSSAQAALPHLSASGDPNSSGGGFFEAPKRFEIPAGEFPEPGLIFFVLRDLLGLPTYGPAEKLRTGVRGRFRGVPFHLELEKFGLRLYLPQVHDAHANLDRELVAGIHTAIRRTAPLLRNISEGQVARGAVTIENRRSGFQFAYAMLRKSAEEAYSADPSAPTTEKHEGFTVTRSSPFLPGVRGDVFATSMIHEYFSRTEHEFLLALAFTDFDPANGGLEEFVNMGWGEKFRVLFDVSQDRPAKQFHDEFLRLRERYRNPLAHGGMNPGAKSFHFHLGGFGALSTRLGGSEPRSFPDLRIGSKTFAAVCTTFDAFDTFLAAHSKTEYGIKFAAAGFDVAFDAASRARYQRAMESDESFEEFLDYMAWETDRHLNMDY